MTDRGENAGRLHPSGKAANRRAARRDRDRPAVGRQAIAPAAWCGDRRQLPSRRIAVKRRAGDFRGRRRRPDRSPPRPGSGAIAAVHRARSAPCAACGRYRARAGDRPRRRASLASVSGGSSRMTSAKARKIASTSRASGARRSPSPRSRLSHTDHRGRLEASRGYSYPNRLSLHGMRLPRRPFGLLAMTRVRTRRAGLLCLRRPKQIRVERDLGVAAGEAEATASAVEAHAQQIGVGPIADHPLLTEAES